MTFETAATPFYGKVSFVPSEGRCMSTCTIGQESEILSTEQQIAFNLRKCNPDFLLVDIPVHSCTSEEAVKTLPCPVLQSRSSSENAAEAAVAPSPSMLWLNNLSITRFIQNLRRSMDMLPPSLHPVSCSKRPARQMPLQLYNIPSRSSLVLFEAAWQEWQTDLPRCLLRALWAPTALLVQFATGRPYRRCSDIVVRIEMLSISEML
jgi:hypothetical protein